MPPITNVALALSLFICLSNFPLLNAAPNTEELFNETYEKVKNKDLFLSSMKDEHASQDAADITALALIAIKIASNNASDTAVYIKKTLIDGNLKEPTIEQNFEDCASSFETAIQALDDALAFIVSRDYKNVNLYLATAIEDATTCASVLDKSLKKDIELSKRTEIFRELCGIALDIVNSLAPNEEI